jgi:hypothetical protein
MKLRRTVVVALLTPLLYIAAAAGPANLGVVSGPSLAEAQVGPPTPSPNRTQAKKVMRRDAKRNCNAVEDTRWVLKSPINILGVPIGPPVPTEVQNGDCLTVRVPDSTCEAAIWPADEPDELLRGNWYHVCNTVIRWRPNEDTWKGVCWEQVGSPKDDDVVVKATRFIEVGYDFRGALRKIYEPWKCYKVG